MVEGQAERTLPERRRSRMLNIGFGVAALAALALTIWLVADYLGYERARTTQSLEVGEAAGHRVADALDARLSAISRRAGDFAGRVADITDENVLLDAIRAESLSDSLLLGVTVAYAPGQFPDRDRFAPFFNKARNEFQFVEDTYDYTRTDLETARWYTKVVASREQSWSDPYYAEAADTMVVDFGVPVLAADDTVLGMVDYTISLADFTEIVDSLSVGEASYGFTYDHDGAILSHPDTRFLMENVFQLQDGKTEALLAVMRDQPEGVVEYLSTYTYKYSWFFFRELESTGWKSVLVFAADDLLGASDTGRRKLIHLGMGAGLLLITLAAWLLHGRAGHRGHAWWLVTVSSLALVGNIVLLWTLNVNTDFSLLEGDRERIVNSTIRNKYVEQINTEYHRRTGGHYTLVPTGILVETYELLPFETSIIGKIWMKYPRSLYDESPPAFYFPTVSALESRGLISEVLSEVEHDDHVLVTWRFRATLEQSFSYNRYPFEQNNIQVMILHPDPDASILLIPDLESYSVLNPSAKPGIYSSMYVPSSETIASFFTFETIDYRTTFGSDSEATTYPVLTFNMVAKRMFLSPLIANLIPLLIVAMMAFVVLNVSSTNDTHGRSGLTTMNVIQSTAGFLFILVLAHVNERGRIQTPEIAYIELFYFVMYLLLTLEAIGLAALLQGFRAKFFTYGDNRLSKLIFWPALLLAWYTATFVRFY